jgi:VanZ family protein
MAAIFAGSSLSKLPPIPGGFSDKVAHFTEYALFGLVLARAVAGPRWLSLPASLALLTVFVAMLYGVSDEIHQRFVPGRDFDPRDMVADTLGAAAAAVALWACGIIRRFSGHFPDVSEPDQRKG